MAAPWERYQESTRTQPVPAQTAEPGPWQSYAGSAATTGRTMPPIGSPEAIRAAEANRAAFMQGLRAPLDEAAVLLVSGLEAIAPDGPVKAWLGEQRQQVEDIKRRAREQFRTEQEPFVSVPGSETAGQVIGTLPALARLPAQIGGRAILGTAAAGAAGGGVAGLLSPSESVSFAEKATQVGTGVAGGAFFGAVAGSVFNKIFGNAGKITAEQLRGRAQQLYKVSDDSGMIINQSKYWQGVDDIKQLMIREGLSKKSHPETYEAYFHLREQIGKGHKTFRGLDQLRQEIAAAKGASAGKDRRLASQLVEEFDDWFMDIKKSDILGGADPRIVQDALVEARALWSRSAKAEVIENLVERASHRASANYTQAGFENALRQQFRALIDNPKKMRFFSEQEAKALERVVTGDLLGNALREVGQLAPKGLIGKAIGIAGGHAIGGPVGAIAVPTAGAAARAGATAATVRNVERALELVLKDVAPGQGAVLSAQQAAILRAALAAVGGSSESGTKAGLRGISTLLGGTPE